MLRLAAVYALGISSCCPLYIIYTDSTISLSFLRSGSPALYPRQGLLQLQRPLRKRFERKWRRLLSDSGPLLDAMGRPWTGYPNEGCQHLHSV